jgi:uncharacterized phosphosugar-binding protein
MANHLMGATQYFEKVRSILDQVMQTQQGAISAAADAVAQTVGQGGAVYLFGTGHSHMMAEEGHYRAGGLAPVIPVLVSSLMIHESAINAGKMERLSGLAGTILSHYQPTAQDVMFIFSNSGVNAVPVEMALEAKKIGMKVVGVSALAYSKVAPLSAAGQRLDEIVDIVIDNQIQAGDAVVEIGNTGLYSGPASTIVGAFILNAVLTEGMCRLYASGKEPSLYISSNMPGAAEHNEELLKREKTRNPHL